MTGIRDLGQAALTAAGLVLATTAPAWAGTTERVSVSSRGTQASGSSDLPSLSADGRFVAFVSDATNLVPGDTNRVFDVFVRDRKLGTTERVSLGPHGRQANGPSNLPFPRTAISAGGRFVA